MSDFKEKINQLGVDCVIKHNTILVEKYPLSYPQFLEIQQLATDYVLAGGYDVYILTNHTTLLTQGRGDRQNQTLGHHSIYPSNIPLYQIKRGGGITMHHPQQWIFYPIVKLHPERWSLIHHLSWLLEVTRETIQDEFAITGLMSQRNPLGLWWGEQKIASVGVGVDRFVTQHGIAVNIGEQPLEIETWNKLNPCGLSSNTYSSLSQKLTRTITIDTFAKMIKARIFNRQIPSYLI
jgi:lipoyl(octanoyl) transferase